MKKTLTIAKTELRNLFYSPVAWFLTIAFMVQCAIFFTKPLQMISKYQDLAQRNNPLFKDFGQSLTKLLFLDKDGIFSNVLENLFLFVPLLTMGLISREVNTGTVKLLYSSPVKLRQIVFGKYIAIMLYNLLLLCVLGIFMIAGSASIVSADIGILLSSALGFYLLMCAYTAIGMFMSSLTNYQIVSAVASFTVVFVLSHIGGLWQRYDFIRDLTYFLSITGRTTKMLRGLVTTSDLVYFIVIVGMFLSFTLLKLKGARESKPWIVKAGRYITVLVVALLIGYITSRPGLIGYLDTTATKENTIHPKLQQILKDMGNEPVEVTLYANLLGDGIDLGLPEARNTYLWTLWEKYIRFKPNIKLKYEYYYDTAKGDSTMFRNFPGKNIDEIAKEMAGFYDISVSRFKKPGSFKDIPGMEDEMRRLVMVVRYKGRSAFLRTFPDTQFWPDQSNIAAVFTQLTTNEQSKVYYTTGNLERSIYKVGEREYQYHTISKINREALINLGFAVDSLSLETKDIPADASMLVLADPKVMLSGTVKDKIRKYVDAGGNMMLFAEPGKQQVLNPVLLQMGVKVMDGTLVEVTDYEMPHHTMPFYTKSAAGLADEQMFLYLRKNWDTVRMLMPGVAGITSSDSGSFTVQPVLINAGRNTWVKMGNLVTDSAAPVFNVQEGDYRMDEFTTAVSLTRKVNNREQRIFIAGDADFMSNLRGGGNQLVRAVYSWLDSNRYPVYAPAEPYKDTLLTISPDTAEVTKIIFVYVLPGMVLLTGIVLLVRRKRQ
ncbi:ABC transporter permease subunit [Pseudobacter ginsenosidimutans]|uniref:ABC-2 type transport system permease protein n=1 Tax=Pseudobacter ginsenosidimutans TaxID=661488 RepID=A0A4Q7MZK3_9BACT|nr:Gldg family protein [Pseudobacter ginsenosidimutans]QEC43344.1 ABC transporter permease subunit [Pseudobacter ginsenosidimutans]RZS74707.1 ABC-2 type transport system permease protein [Pseudobacter ginsenosidimutans]